MKSELEKHPALLGNITQYWKTRHMDDNAFAHYMLGMYLVAAAFGNDELASDISMLEQVFSYNAFTAPYLQEAA